MDLTHPIDPGAQSVLDLIRAAGRPPTETLTPAEARAVYAASRAVMQPPPPAVAEVRELTAPGPGGPIRLRAYRPAGTEPGAVLPGMVYFHGGGWVLGDLDSHDGVCRRLANAALVRVVSVEYRLAPEHPFPAAVDDALAATRYVSAQAGTLGIDPARLAVGGDSAGGNLAASVALLARDAGHPRLAYQLLFYPSVDLSTVQGSYQRVTTGFPLTATTMRWFRDLYLRSPADIADPRASPLRAPSLAGLPPAYVLTAWHDPLCDEGGQYAERLRAAGVAVQLRAYTEQMHGFLTMGLLIPAALGALDAAGSALKSAIG